MRLSAFLGLTIAVALVISQVLPSSLVRYVNKAFAQGRLYQLTSEERRQLDAVLESARVVAGIQKSFSVNEKYRRDRINVYIIQSQESPEEAITQGNAAFSRRDDILLIDGSYFLLGNDRVLSEGVDIATEKALRTVRVYAYFVLLHELGHRSLQSTWWSFKHRGFHADPERETEADRFAIDALLRIYESDAKKASNVSKVMPGPVSSFIDFSGDTVGPGCRLADHLSFALASLSETVLENPFPLLSPSDSHPAFLRRILEIFATIGELPDVRANEDAKRTLSLGKAVVESAQNLARLGPTEISFSSPIDYAFLTPSALFYFDAGATLPSRIDLDRMRPNSSIRIRNLSADEEQASVQYAWINSRNEISVVRRDGVLSTWNQSGRLLNQTPLSGKLGDQTCALEMVVPTLPTQFAYILYCEQGELFAKLIENGELRRGIELASVAAPISRDTHQDPVRVVQMTIGFDEDLSLYAEHSDDFYLVEVASDLSFRRASELREVPASVSLVYQGRRLPFKTYLHSAPGGIYFFEGSGMFRSFSMNRVDGNGLAAVSSYAIFEGARDSRMTEILPIRRYRFISRTEAVVDMVEAGVFLIDFSAGKILPISYHSFGDMEQLLANDQGDWLLYRKYGNRILFIPYTGGRQ